MCIQIRSVIPGVSVTLKSRISRLVKILKQKIFAVKENLKLTRCVLTEQALEDIGSAFRSLYTKIFNNVTLGNRGIEVIGTRRHKITLFETIIIYSCAKNP